jgi:hypothetical protein
MVLFDAFNIEVLKPRAPKGVVTNKSINEASNPQIPLALSGKAPEIKYNYAFIAFILNT